MIELVGKKKEIKKLSLSTVFLIDPKFVFLEFWTKNFIWIQRMSEQAMEILEEQISFFFKSFRTKTIYFHSIQSHKSKMISFILYKYSPAM